MTLAKTASIHKPALQQAERFKELDSLRGFAALYVMVQHYSNMAGYDIAALHAGATGVDLFFIISGYVIFMTLKKTNHPREFIISRLSRLFPSYIVMMCITLLALLIFRPAEFPPRACNIR